MVTSIVQMATSIYNKRSTHTLRHGFCYVMGSTIHYNYENFNSFMQYRRGAQFLCKGTEDSHG